MLTTALVVFVQAITHLIRLSLAGITRCTNSWFLLPQATLAIVTVAHFKVVTRALMVLVLICFALLIFSCLSSHKVSKRYIFSDRNRKSVAQCHLLNLFSPQTINLNWQSACIKVTLTELTIEVRAPRIDCTSSINSHREASFLFTYLDVSEVDTVHTDFLRRAEHSELTSTPHD